MNWQQPLAKMYTELSVGEVVERIAARKAELGPKVVILGHHYQQDNIIRFADIVGDSFQLSRDAAKLPGAQYIIFCGVHFMAESADVLTADDQQVILPDLGAGCSMADMANLEDVQDAWAYLTALHQDIPGFQLVPITYMNSTAAIKAFVGAHGGAVCTSSNCEKVLKWALGDETPSAASAKRKVVFFPDQHLGRNTAFKMGYPLSAMATWDYKQADGGLTDEQLLGARFFLWKGHCSVHMLFKPEHVDEARAKYPGVRVIVHPECTWEVVQKADMAGSTDFIGKTIAAAPAGSSWSVGTEVHMVHRLAKTYPDKHITTLSECQCLCTTMYRIDPPHLLYVLDELAAGRVINRISVDAATKKQAHMALQRMLDITAGTSVTGPCLASL